MHKVLEAEATALVALLEEHANDIDFGTFGEGVSAEWVAKAENRLQVKFPPSYKWWLENFGGGTLYGDEVFSIYELDFDTVVGGDVVYMNELERKDAHLPATHLLIYTTDQGESYFIDLDKTDEYGESPVYINAGDLTSRYASNFLEFLKNQLVNG